ncbi:hypothetical protein B0H14DRAFT_2804601 [Mycena olivaceomarginata]|nr:hypothetical protein B0H14DRAFT_2804601 [Mycena olivaceomarginata]
MVSILHFVFCVILSVQSLPTPDISLDLDSNIKFNTTGNSSALIDVKVAIQDVALGPKPSSSLTRCAQDGAPSASFSPIIKSSGHITPTPSAVRSSGLHQSPGNLPLSNV